MKLILQRNIFTPTRTGGAMRVGNVTFYTCEDKVREVPGVPVEQWKVPRETAIPEGIYKVIIDYSNRFGKEMPHVLDVPGFAGIRIHAGNTEADTEGCILVGSRINGDGTIPGGASRPAYNALFTLLDAAYLRKEDITLEVRGRP